MTEDNFKSKEEQVAHENAQVVEQERKKLVLELIHNTANIFKKLHQLDRETYPEFNIPWANDIDIVHEEVRIEFLSEADVFIITGGYDDHDYDFHVTLKDPDENPTNTNIYTNSWTETAYDLGKINNEVSITRNHELIYRDPENNNLRGGDGSKTLEYGIPVTDPGELEVVATNITNRVNFIDQLINQVQSPPLTE